MSQLSNHGRLTAEYDPTKPGSREENQAINARREMLNVFGSGEVIRHPRRKTWAERMAAKARGFRVK